MKEYAKKITWKKILVPIELTGMASSTSERLKLLGHADAGFQLSTDITNSRSFVSVKFARKARFPRVWTQGLKGIGVLYLGQECRKQDRLDFALLGSYVRNNLNLLLA
jgi:hypothetical protein